MSEDVSEFRKMWKENHHPDNEVELVKSSDVEMLIRLTDELYEQCKLFERMLECGFPRDVSEQCNMLAQVRELLAKADGRGCKHHHYETRTHPELGDQPFCPACDEFIEL